MNGRKPMTDAAVLENLAGNGNPGWRSICQVHRELYQLTKDMPAVVALLVEAHRMAKKMDAKLRRHKERV